MPSDSAKDGRTSTRRFSQRWPHLNDKLKFADLLPLLRNHNVKMSDQVPTKIVFPGYEDCVPDTRYVWSRSGKTTSNVDPLKVHAWKVVFLRPDWQLPPPKCVVASPTRQWWAEVCHRHLGMDQRHHPPKPGATKFAQSNHQAVATLMVGWEMRYHSEEPLRSHTNSRACRGRFEGLHDWCRTS